MFNEPTVVAMNASTGAVQAMGDEAWQMIGGRSGNIVAVRPLRHGVMTEFDITQRMIEVVLRRVGVSRLPKPRVLACIPSEASEIERRAVDEAVRFAGGKGVVLVEEPLAAAIGAGLPIHEPQGNLIVDIGGGTTEMAVVSMGGVVSGRSVRVGGFDLDAAIQEHFRSRYGVMIGEKAAEELKIAIGSAFPGGKPRAAIVTGRELDSGAPREVRVTDDEVRAGDVRARPPDRRGGATRPSPRPLRSSRTTCSRPGCSSPAAAGCSAVSTSCCPRSARSPSTSPSARSRPSCSAPARCSSTSTSTRARSSSCAGGRPTRVAGRGSCGWDEGRLLAHEAPRIDAGDERPEQVERARHRDGRERDEHERADESLQSLADRGSLRDRDLEVRVAVRRVRTLQVVVRRGTLGPEPDA